MGIVLQADAAEALKEVERLAAEHAGAERKLQECKDRADARSADVRAAVTQKSQLEQERTEMEAKLKRVRNARKTHEREKVEQEKEASQIEGVRVASEQTWLLACGSHHACMARLTTATRIIAAADHLRTVMRSNGMIETWQQRKIVTVCQRPGRASQCMCVQCMQCC